MQKKCQCPYKQGECPHNDNTKELPIEFFHKSINRGKPYSDPKCKNLYNYLKKIRKDNNGEYSYEINVLLKNWDKIDKEGTRTCRKCEINKPLSEFHKINENDDKYQLYCKECNKEVKKEFLQNNPEKKIEYNEKCIITTKKWKEKQLIEMNLFRSTYHNAKKKNITHNLTP